MVFPPAEEAELKELQDELEANQTDSQAVQKQEKAKDFFGELSWRSCRTSLKPTKGIAKQCRRNKKQKTSLVP